MSGTTSLLSDPQQCYTKEAWVRMSHIVLEGRRKPELSNVLTAHAIAWSHYTTLIIPLEKFRRFQVQGSITLLLKKLSAWDISLKPIAKIRLFSQISKKSHSYRQKVVFLQHILKLNPANNGDWHSFGIQWPYSATSVAGGKPHLCTSLLGGHLSGQNSYA